MNIKRFNSSHPDEDDLFHIAFAGILLLVFLFLLSIIIVTDKQETIVTDKTWMSWVEVREDYTTVSCTYVDEKMKCRPVENTRILDRREIRGNYKQEFHYPVGFELYGDRYNVYGEVYTIHYQTGYTNAVGESSWLRDYYIEQSCTISLNVWGFVVKDRCYIPDGR